MKYLIKLELFLGEYEKMNQAVVEASTKEEAQIIALIGECHNEPDFSEFPEKNGVWDGTEFVYKIYDIQEINEKDYRVLKRLKICYNALTIGDIEEILDIKNL